MTEQEQNQWEKTVQALAEVPTYCKVCGKFLPLKSFNKPHIDNKNGGKVYYGPCKRCIKDQRLQKMYGITLDQYNDLFSKQNGACAICGKRPSAKRGLAVDHNHITNDVRGLLCSSCNILIGYAQDCPDILEKAATYLHRTNH